MKIEIVQVDESGRISFSPKVRKSLGLKPGEQFEVLVNGNEIVLKPIRNVPRTTNIDLTQVEDQVRRVFVWEPRLKRICSA